MKSVKIIPVLLCLILCAASAFGEDNKNYSDCGVCPGSIHYGYEEARELMGKEGLDLIRRVDESVDQVILLDLDGVMKPARTKEKEPGYEIKITGFKNIIYIKSLMDDSYIQIVTDSGTARQSAVLSDWHPEIYLQSGDNDHITLKDTTEAAWDRMKQSHIYNWITSGKDEVKIRGMLKEKILYTLALLATP